MNVEPWNIPIFHFQIDMLLVVDAPLNDFDVFRQLQRLSLQIVDQAVETVRVNFADRCRVFFRKTWN